MHTHSLVTSTNTGTQKVPTSNVLATLASGGGSAYSPTPPTTALAAQSIGQAPGGSQPHDNMQPYLCHHVHHRAVRHVPEPGLKGAPGV